MMPDILVKSARDRRRGYLGWIAGIVGLVAFTTSFYPSVKDNQEFLEAFESIPEGFKVFIGDSPLTSPIGYLDNQLFVYVIPLMFLIYAIGHSADAIAGEEQRHTMDLLLSNPVTRRRVVLEKFGAVGTGLLGLGAILFVALFAGTSLLDMEVGATGMAAAVTGCVLLAGHFGGLALALSAATAKKALAVGVTSALATAAFLVNSLGRQVDALEPVRKLSSFYYYAGSSPLENGFPLGHFAVLAAVAVAFVAAAVVLFERRDVVL